MAEPVAFGGQGLRDGPERPSLRPQQPDFPNSLLLSFVRVVVPGSTDFPESMSASSDGTLYFSSFGNGRIWRAKPGETQASEWIKPGSNGTASALGVLADDKSNTLYVCSDDFSAAAIKITGGTATSLKLFNQDRRGQGKHRYTGTGDLVQ